MKIEKVSIGHFGILEKIDLDLSAEQGNLVFLNGINGRGKTTFQSALRWCFYNEEPEASKFLSTYALNRLEVGESVGAFVEVEIKMDAAGSSAGG